MNPKQKIVEDQKAWAKSKGLSFDPKGYARDAETNLRRPLSACALRGFNNGAGSELAGHMKALHSSSALVANFFDYWTGRDKCGLLSALEIDVCNVESLEFEAQFPTGLGGTPPHLDVAIALNSGVVIGIESKFTEHMGRSTKGKSEFEPSYFPHSGGLWAGVGLPECQGLAEELHDGRHKFEYLDPWQLLKHALGLATQLHDQFTLYYLYYDYPGERSETHKREIWNFASRVGEEILFKAVSYQEAFGRLSAFHQTDAEYLDYIDYLGTRYFPTA